MIVEPNVHDIVNAPHTCCFCREELSDYPIGANNADPVAPLGSECCNSCNDMFVTPTRQF